MNRAEREAWMRSKAALAALPKHPSWSEYVRVHEDAAADIRKRMLRHVEHDPELSQRQVDFWRGQLDILEWNFTMPIAAERQLITYLRKQGVELELEEEEENV